MTQASSPMDWMFMEMDEDRFPPLHDSHYDCALFSLHSWHVRAWRDYEFDRNLDPNLVRVLRGCGHNPESELKVQPLMTYIPSLPILAAVDVFPLPPAVKIRTLGEK